MTRLFQSIRVSDLVWYVVVILVAILSWESQSFMQHLANKQLQAQAQVGVVGESSVNLSAVQTKQFDAYLELNRLLTTLGTTLLGAVFFLLFNSSRRLVWKRRRWAAFLGALFIAVSIFFGYVAYLSFILMLQNGNPLDVTIYMPHWAQQAHFYTFLLGVIFLADFIFHNLPEGVAHGS